MTALNPVPAYSKECHKHKSPLVIIRYVKHDVVRGCPVCIHIARVKVQLELSRFNKFRRTSASEVGKPFTISA